MSNPQVPQVPQVPQQQWLPPQPPPRRGLPGWAIALIAVIGGGALTVLAFGFGVLIWIATVVPGPSHPTVSPVPPPSAPSEPRGEMDYDEAPEMGRDGEATDGDRADESASALATRTSALYDQYLAASRNGTISDLVPGGDAVDPNYFADFLYLLADLKGATAFMGSGDAAAIAEIGAEVDELERRFLAGEDLGSSVKITSSDGSVYESDGKYRLKD